MSTLQQSMAGRRAVEIAAVSAVLADERQSALIISAWKGASWVLPWAQFVSARLDGESLELFFANCLVVATGQNLRALLDDIAAYRIGVLRELPVSYRQRSAEGAAFIVRIEVRPLMDRPARDSPA